MRRPADTRRGARVVESGGLENRCALPGTVGSNPTLSASPDHVRLGPKTEASSDRFMRARRGGGPTPPCSKTERCESG
jgi:hypothetical protein